jgi:FtsH-binding integral membrane protein
MSQPYARFGVTLLLSLVAMWVISLLQVETLDHAYLNLSNLYIALTGVGVMGLIMFASMRGMFKDGRRSAVTVVALVMLVLGGIVLARTETFVGDRAFLESMIPHHSRALVVCQESDLSDPEIVALCEQIVRSQREEISQMQDILGRS